MGSVVGVNELGRGRDGSDDIKQTPTGAATMKWRYPKSSSEKQPTRRSSGLWSLSDRRQTP